MANMSYCKFENTLNDLKQCLYYWDECESESEIEARKQLRKLCKEVAKCEV